MGGCNHDDSMINVWGDYGVSKTSAAYINKRYNHQTIHHTMLSQWNVGIVKIPYCGFNTAINFLVVSS